MPARTQMPRARGSDRPYFRATAATIIPVRRSCAIAIVRGDRSWRVGRLGAGKPARRIRLFGPLGGKRLDTRLRLHMLPVWQVDNAHWGRGPGLLRIMQVGR